MKANLFYRGLSFHRFPVIGDTLSTRNRSGGIAAEPAAEGRRPTGMAALRMTTVDQCGRQVLDFFRCAMLPLSPGCGADTRTSHADDLSAIGMGGALNPRSESLRRTRPPDWRADVFRQRVPGPYFHPGMAARCCTARATSSARHLSSLD